jgi:S1-C subfamily serine protease
LIRSVSGTKGQEQGGRYLIEDPRTVFYAPADKQVIVHFTWEGPAGPHHFEALWKSPEGKVVMISDFDYKPDQPRFAAYFRMLLSETPATGVWTVEARIDGETAGTHNFQIVIAPRPENESPARRVLSRADMYGLAASASVMIENIGPKGERRNVGSGFFVAPGRILTAFQIIDAATRVRITVSGGRPIEVTEVSGWNRRQDWIILKVPIEKVTPLPRATPASWAVGDRCYTLDVPAEGNRVLIETYLIGKQSAGAGERLNISEILNPRAVGAPVLNEYGEVIGLVGGNLISSAAFVGDPGFLARSFFTLGETQRGALAVPLTLVDESTPNNTTIEGLATSGQFTPPLAGNQNVLNGTLARSVNPKGNPPRPMDEKLEFSRRDGKGVAFVTWLPKEKLKGFTSVRLYDLNNRLIYEDRDKKRISLSPEKLAYQAWDLSLGGLTPGIYRIDVLLEADTVWRTFFRVVE